MNNIKKIHSNNDNSKSISSAINAIVTFCCFENLNPPNKLGGFSM